MSRNNARVARQIREGEVAVLRKNILKSSGYAAVTNGLLDQLQDSDAGYQERLAKLCSFSSKSKATVKTVTVKNEWRTEQDRLCRLAQKVELSICSSLETAIAISPDCGELHELVSEMDEYKRQESIAQSALTDQLKQLRRMLKETRKKLTQSEGKSIGDKTSSAVKSSLSPALSVLAQVLLRIRTDQSTAWESLLAEELAVSKSTEGNLKTQQLSILELLRSDRIEKQNSALKEEFMQLLHEEGVYDLDGLENSNSGGDESKLDNGELLLGMEILMLQWYQRIGGVDKAYKEQCRIINLEKATLSAKLRGKSAVDKNVDEEYGFESSEGLNCSSQKSWTQEEIELFAKEYRRWQVSGSGRKLLMTMLQSQLPSKSYDEIVEHESCFRQFQALGVKQREEQTSYEQQRIDLLRQAKEAVKQHVKAYKEAKEKETTLKELEMRREVMHRKLEHLRRIREQEAMILQQEERKRIEKEQQQSDLAKEMALLEQQERKSLVEAYHRQKQEEQAQRAAEEEKRHEELQEEILRMIEENRPKVELRAQLEREKKDKQRQKELEYAAAEAHKLEILAKLAQQVPYYESLLNATSKLDHVTASAKAQEYVAPGPDSLSQLRGHIPMNGFTDQRVISDSRFRLSEALRSAGIQHSQAAAAAVARAHPRPHLAIHGLL